MDRTISQETKEKVSGDERDALQKTAAEINGTTDTVKTGHKQKHDTPSIFDVFTGLEKDETKTKDEGPRSSSQESKETKGGTSTGNSKKNGSSFQINPELHRRSVSFGQAEFFADDRIASHGRSESNSGMQRPAGSDGSENVTFEPRRSRSQSAGARIEIEDVASHCPMETEAETYILQALEARDPTTRSREGSDSRSQLLAGVPDEATGVFQGEETNQDSNASSLHDTSRHLSDQLSISRRTASRRTLAAREAYQRDKESMAQKLFGLTTAIDVIQAQHKDDFLPGEEPPSTKATLSSSLKQATSSADAFQQNASILYNRGKRQKRTDEETEISETQSIVSSIGTTSHWLRNAIRNGSLHRRKTRHEEGERPGPTERVEALDEELGGGGIEEEEYSSSVSGESAESPFAEKMKEELKIFKEFQEFFTPHKESIKNYLKLLIFYIMVPLIGIAASLFHLAGNPPTGKLDNNGRPVDEALIDPDRASVSWILLFVLRQILVGSLAKGMELLLIDFLSIRSRSTIRLIGPWPTLFILQSRGWPFIVFMWGLLDFALLAGSGPFFHHWTYWQDVFDLINRSNPSGDVVESDWNHRVLAIAVSVGFVVAMKRFCLGLYLGRQTFCKL